jgi:F-box and leucine-rich repeat protein 10/11
MPSNNFQVSDVKSCVGSKRLLDVYSFSNRKNFKMTMKDWCEYYENRSKNCQGQILNVINLEFSNTKLETYVEAPSVVRQLDWMETVWPKSLVTKLEGPKVQKYVIMSIEGCFTDFHIGMGGTSAWYHVLKGEKIFWLIPPTQKNLEEYEKWMISGRQASIFLPDVVEECQCICIKSGWTFMVPSGWIHSVVTVKDSLVFGGYFLNSFSIPMQLKVPKKKTL